MAKMYDIIQELNFINILTECFKLYIEKTSRSNKKVMILHEFIKIEINKIIKDKKDYSVDIEYNVKCLNSSGKKRCDIVIFKKLIPIIVIPTKFICRNYKQNKNNYLENLVGESYLLKQMNKNIKIIPLNIYIQNCHYYNKNNIKIKNEYICGQDIDILNKIDIFDHNVNLLIEVDYLNKKVKKINNFINIFNYLFLDE